MCEETVKILSRGAKEAAELPGTGTCTHSCTLPCMHYSIHSGVAHTQWLVQHAGASTMNETSLLPALCRHVLNTPILLKFFVWLYWVVSALWGFLKKG